MRCVSLAVASLTLAISSIAACDTPTTSIPSVKPLDEVWEVALVQNDSGVDVKIGHVHLNSAAIEKDGKKFIRTTKELRFVVGRADAKAEMKADVSSDEDADGKVHAITARIWLGQDKVQTIDCEIQDTNILVNLGPGAKKFRWDPANLGLAREQTFLRDKKQSRRYVRVPYYEVQVTHPVTFTCRGQGSRRCRSPWRPSGNCSRGCHPIR